MPRLPKPRGFDIRDAPADCYDATGQFPQLAPHVTTGPVTADAADHEHPEDAEGEDTIVAAADAPHRSGQRHWWAGAAVLAVAVLAFVTAARQPGSRPTAPAPRPAPVPVAPSPAPAVAAPASAVKPERKRRPRPRRSRPRRRQRPSRPRPVQTVVVPAPRPVRPSVAPVPHPAPKPVPAGGEFILGAR